KQTCHQPWPMPRNRSQLSATASRTCTRKPLFPMMLPIGSQRSSRMPSCSSRCPTLSSARSSLATSWP
ncbi:unnamed protein product, partial [Durusdinium trenchii]